MDPKRPARDATEPTGLVHPRNFLNAMRDAGYRGPAQAVAEFIDNALEAGADRVRVTVTKDSEQKAGVQIAVIDNGSGMSPRQLSEALTFGGSSRFDSRTSYGRFGMGLPSASLSLARRVEVKTWRGASLHVATLQVGSGASVPRASVRTRRWGGTDVLASASGTEVTLHECDRVPYERVGWLARSLATHFGRIYCSDLQRGLRLEVNGEAVLPLDHLQLSSGGARHGDVLTYELDGVGGRGRITVEFSELPVLEWATLSSAEKAKRGIPTSNPISVSRAGREIERGWWFMGTKRRENYDSWWRCQIDFEPSLDEWFGITFTKQQIRPTQAIVDVLSPDLEAIGRSLNSRARRQFELMKIADPLKVAEQITRSALEASPNELSSGAQAGGLTLELSDLVSVDAYEVRRQKDGVAVVLNAGHPFVRDLYAPLAAIDSPDSHRAATQVALLAVAQAAVGAAPVDDSVPQRRWSDFVATLLERCR